MLINVKVKPQAKTDSITYKNNIYYISVKQPAKEGKANQAIIKILGEYFSIPKYNISIKQGHKNKTKIIEIINSKEHPIKNKPLTQTDFFKNLSKK